MEKRILYLEPFSGISGDMFIGGLIDLGIEMEWLEGELQKLGLSNEYQLSSAKGEKKGISGTKFDVHLTHHQHEHKPHVHEHAHPHTHDQHEHNHDHDHAHPHKHKGHHQHPHESHTHHHHGRNLPEIEQMIKNAQYPKAVEENALALFQLIGIAEAKIHNKSINEVHFHEVGAIDSIVDIVGSALCMHKLQIDEVKCGAVQVGYGTVKCDHGVLPVPAPATLEILKGIPISSGNIKGELVTPTGASILKHYVNAFEPMPELIIENIGYGLGTKDFDQANVLRLVVGKKKA